MRNKIDSIVDLISIKNGEERSPVADLKSYIKAHTFDRSKIPEEDDTILFLQGIPIGSKEGIISITGRSKSRKTVFASAVASAMFLDNISHLGFTSTLPKDARILHIDTEQGYKHYYNSVVRIFDDAHIEDTPDRFTSIHTRDADIPFRKELIEHMITAIKPAVTIIDGVSDLVYDINSQEEATKLGELLLRWGTTYNMLIVVVIHTTKTTGFMTGNLGTVLEKKSETVLKVELDDEDRMVSHLSCQYSRNAPFASFSIVADSDGKYSILSETEIDNKGKGGQFDPRSESDLQHDLLIDRMLGLAKKIKKDDAKKALIRAVKDCWSGKVIKQNEAISFIKYYMDKAWLAVTSENEYVRYVPVIPPVPGHAQMAISVPDDHLPF